ncbi:hypothetical protein D3C72_1670400 [compost metagenome]
MAIDAMPVDAGAHRLYRFARPFEQVACILTAKLAFQLVDLTAVADQCLAAIAARGSPADPLRFQHHHALAAPGQFQCGGEAGVTGAQYRDIGLQLTAQWRQRGRFGQAAGVPAGREGGAHRRPRRSGKGRRSGGGRSGFTPIVWPKRSARGVTAAACRC